MARNADDDSGSGVDSLVVPLDGSDDAAMAVPVASRLAGAIGANLELLSTVDEPDEVAERLQALHEVPVSGDKVDRTVVVEADPVVAITQGAQRPGRHLCMATKGRGRTAAVVGSVALGVLRSIGRPILCVGPRLGVTRSAAPSVGVLVCLDGSAHSEAALEPAVRWAALLGEPLTLATAVEDAPPSASGRRSSRWLAVEDPHDYLATQAARLDDRVGSIDTRVLTDPLHPAGALRSLLSHEAATMVAAGTRGRSGIARAVLGSVASEIVQHSAAPVLLVPAQS
jgi:nucleotide-binding universal stress UspA family protein